MNNADKLQFLKAICKKYNISYFLIYQNDKNYNVLTDVEIANTIIAEPMHEINDCLHTISFPIYENFSHVGCVMKLTAKKIEALIEFRFSQNNMFFRFAIDLASAILNSIKTRDVYLFGSFAIGTHAIIPAKTDPFQFIIDSELNA